MYPSHFLERFTAPILLVVVLFCNGCSTQSTDVLRIAFRNNAARFPLLIAKKDSFFEKHGLRSIEFPIGSDDLFRSAVYYEQFDVVMDTSLDTLLRMESVKPGCFQIVSMSDCTTLQSNDSVFVCMIQSSSLERNPETMKKFLECWSAFVVRMANQKEQYRKFLAKQFNLGEGYHNLIDFPSMQPWHQIDCEATEKYIVERMNQSDLTKPIDIKTLLVRL